MQSPSNNLIVLENPMDLCDNGFSIKPDLTLLDHDLYQEHRKAINGWVDSIPELALRPPREYQQRYAALAAIRGHNLLGHEQGLGKTYETILIILLKYGAALMGKAHKPLRRGAILIVAPRHTLKLAWMNEFKLCGLDKFVDIVTNERQLDSSQAPIWLTHYDFLKNQTRHGRNLQRSGKTRTKLTRGGEPEPYFLGHPVWKKIRRIARPHMIVFDEIHSLREGSDRTEACQQLIRGVKNRLGMTGTPIDGWVSHLATILGILYGSDNTIFPWTPKSFTKRFTRERVVDLDYVTGEAGATPHKRTAPGINPDQIPEFWRSTRHLMHRLIYRDPEVSAHVKFPPIDYHLERCQMDPNHAAFYYELHQQVAEMIRDAVKQVHNGSMNSFRQRQNVLTNINLLRQAASCPWSITEPLTFQSEDISKVRRAVEICKEAAKDGRKTIIFTNFIDTGFTLTRALKTAGLGTIRIYAEDRREKPVSLLQDSREERIETFLEDPSVDVLVGNLGLLSTGLTLTQASVIINYDQDWKANAYKQGIARAARPGQVYHKVDVWDLVSDRTVDNYVITILMNKINETAKLIDHQFSLEEGGRSDIDPMAIAKAIIAGDLAVA